MNYLKRRLQQAAMTGLVYLNVATVLYAFGVRAMWLYTISAIFIGIAVTELWPEAPSASWADRNMALLGKQVRVTLDRPEHGPAHVTNGRLLCFGDEGTLVIVQDDGFVHYAWPMLDIEACE
jgi:hypothetical protein